MMARPIPIGGRPISSLFMKNRYIVYTGQLHNSFKKYQTRKTFDLPPPFYCRTLHFCYSEWLHVGGRIFWHSKITKMRFKIAVFNFTMVFWPIYIRIILPNHLLVEPQCYHSDRSKITLLPWQQIFFFHFLMNLAILSFLSYTWFFTTTTVVLPWPRK